MVFKHLFLLSASIIIAFFVGLASYGILNNNEGLYAQIGWETLATNHWVIPHLDSVPYLEKPPLLYWFLAGSFKLFGKTVLAARLVPALSGVLTVGAWIWFGMRLQHKRWGFWSAFLLSASLGFALFSRMIFFDVLLTLLITLSLFNFYLFYQYHSKKNLFFFWGCLGFSLLAKGFVALILVGGTVTVFLVWKKEWPSFIKMLHPVAIGLFLCIILPWHVAAFYNNPDFAWFYFVNEHVLRFLDLRIPRDYYRGSILYYIPRVLTYTMPWTFVAGYAVYSTNKYIKKSQSDSLFKFLLTWFVFCLLFFSLSKAKANYYMVAGLPPLAGLVAFFWEKWKGAFRWSVGITVFNGVLFSVALWKIPLYEGRLSAAPFFAGKQFTEQLVYYKRFEEISSFLFYYNKPIPIVHSESRDLWFAQSAGYGKSIFLQSLGGLESPNIIVLKRDQEAFQKEYPSFSTAIYATENYTIYSRG